jgi:hypothetical protein
MQAHAAAPPDRRAAFGIAIAFYVAAKLGELNDHAIYGQLGVMSGHTAKHLLATAACAVVVAEFARREPADRAARHEMTPAPIHSTQRLACVDAAGNVVSQPESAGFRSPASAYNLKHKRAVE